MRELYCLPSLAMRVNLNTKEDLVTGMVKVGVAVRCPRP